MKILTTKTEDFSHRKILITGSSGFVGSHLVKKLSKKHSIVQYDLVNNEDVLDEKLLSKKLKGVDLVIHLAAFISATESWERPMDYIRNNSLGTLSVVKCSIEAGVKKLIFFSSAAVKAKPLTPYAVSKINAESIVNLYKDKLKTIIVRPENIYGPGQKEAYGYVIHSFIKAIKGGLLINIYGDGEQTRDFIYVDDVVSSVEKLMSANLDSGSIVSLGTGKSISVNDLANTVMKVVGKKTSITHLEAREEPRSSNADIKSMKENGVNYRDFIDLKSGIRKVLELQYN